MIIDVIILVIFIVFIFGLLFLAQGPQYAPSSDENSRLILDFIKNYNPKRIIDIGSGDGRLVLMLARNGYQADGIEINPLLVLRSRRLLKKAGYSTQCTIYFGNFWKHNFATYDGVVVFAIKHVMPKLEKKLFHELSPGTPIISNYFTFPSLSIIDQKDDVQVYLTPQE